MKCKICGKKVSCKEHGDTFIVEDEDLCGLKFYYCDKCVEEYFTALGAVVHDHIVDVMQSKEFEKAWEEVFSFPMPKFKIKKMSKNGV